VGNYHVAAVDLDAKPRIGQRFGNDTLNFQGLFFFLLHTIKLPKNSQTFKKPVIPRLVGDSNTYSSNHP
jgi:hypothetical protein